MDHKDTTSTYEPYFSYNHGMAIDEHQAFYHCRRQHTGRKDMPGTELLLSFVDLDFNPAVPRTETVFAHTLCTNRGLAEEVPAGAVLQIEQAAPLSNIVTLAKPTPQINPPMDGAALWRLISHLSLNYLSLADGEESINALREILRLYCVSSYSDTHQQINGLRQMSCRSVVRRIGQTAWKGFCRGKEITLQFDEEMYVGSSAFLLGAVLNRFFPLYASINTFTQLIIQSNQREGIWKKWQPMAGDQIVL